MIRLILNLTKKKIIKKNNAGILLMSATVLASLTGLGFLVFKNLRSSDANIKKGIKNTKIGLENIIEQFNKKQQIDPIKGHNDEILTDDNAYKFIIENMLERIYATPKEIEYYVSKMNLKNDDKLEFINYLKQSRNQATEKVNPTMGGSGRNKITYFSHVNDSLSFFYDWLMNPSNPQFKNLFLGIAGASAISYGGKNYADAIKEVQVKKYNADIELNLQKRLVATELRNFYAKKQSAIEPLCEEFFRQKEEGKSREELKIIADNILFEIKNGPPFVYS